ncbi:MAG: hypothetical protein CMF41_02900 [Legionellales bacterium]|nr:hypothetical protein [Legionellales bacterium]
MLFLSESILTFFILTTFMSGLLVRKSQQRTYSFSMSILIVSLVGLQLALLPISHMETTGWIVDSMSQYFKLFSCILSIYILICTKNYIKKSKIKSFEFYILFLTTLLGVFVVCSSNDFMVLFVGLELIALPLYAMLALFNSRKSYEASLKYFILGAIASGLFLFGISLVYGITGDVTFFIPRNTISLSEKLQAIAVLMVLIGLIMKIGMAPFHYWVPDVYEGAPLPVLMVIATLPKYAYLAAVLRLSVSNTLSISIIPQMIIVLSVVSIFIGNLGALTQTSLKRLLGFSSIAHMGFMLLALYPSTQNFVPIFYLIVYSITTLIALTATIFLCENNEIDEIDSYQGLYLKRPLHAFIYMTAFFSMAGVPPLAGFMAKLNVFYMLFYQAEYQTWIYTAAVIAILFAVIGTAYYIRFIRVLYFEKKMQTRFKTPTYGQNLLIGVPTSLLLILGVAPGLLIEICQNATPMIK